MPPMEDVQYQHHEVPAPVVLPSLNNVLQAFHGSYHATATTLIAFDWLMKYSTDDFTDDERIGAWQSLLLDLRDPDETPFYRDPESLQVAQMLARADSLSVMRELSVNPHASCEVICKSTAGSSTDVPCGGVWLVECAKLGLGNTSEPTHGLFLRHVEHLTTPQPVYEDADIAGIAIDHHPIQDSMIIGPGGTLLPVAKLAFQQGIRDFRNLVRRVVRIAMDVADIWTYTKNQDHRQPKDQPPFKWYYVGLLQSRDNFAELVTNYPDNPQEALSYQVRDSLKSLSFVVLWDWLWQNARDVGAVYQAENRIHFILTEMVRTAFENLEGLPDSKLLGDMVFNNVPNIASHQDPAYTTYPRPQDYPVEIDSEEIEAVQVHHMKCHWGRRFYGDELPYGFSTDSDVVLLAAAEINANNDEDDAEEIPQELLGDIEEEADLEAYGPWIDPKKFATIVEEEDQPREQNCTICTELYEPNTQARCLKIQVCGHYFHESCIRDWMNGIALNSNLCPECRKQICAERRSVRVKEPLPSDGSDSEAVSNIEWTVVVGRHLFWMDVDHINLPTQLG
jgi:hypothetical protein